MTRRASNDIPARRADPSGQHLSGVAARPSERGVVSVIGNVFAVLRCFTTAQPSLGVTEIAAEVGLHKSSVSRMLATLEEEGILERDEATKKYRLGMGLIAVAGPLLAGLDVRRVALPALHRLTDETEETSALVLWNGDESVIVEQVPSPQEVKHTTALGTRYRTAYSASVQIFLAGAGAVSNSGLTVAPAHLESLRVELAEVAARGYAINYGRTSPDAVGIAAPVRDHRGQIAAGVLLAAPSFRVLPEAIPELGTRVVDAAQEISGRLGYHP